MKKLIVATLLAGTLIIAGCSAQSGSETNPQTTQQEVKEQESEAAEVPSTQEAAEAPASGEKSEESTEAQGTEAAEASKPEAFDGDITNNSLAISPDETIAVVSYSKIPGIKVYDLTQKKVIAELDEFVTPRNIAFSKDGSHFYVSDSSYGSIREFDSKSLEVTRTFELKQGVFGFAVTKDGKRIFANNQFESTVTVINLEDGSIEKVIEGFSRPRQGIVIDSNDTYAYVTNFEGNDVRVVNTSTLEIEKTLSGIPDVRAISIDKEGKYLYGASSSGDTINVVDIASGEVVKTIAVGEEPYGSALSPDGTLILTGEKVSNQVSVIDVASLEVLRTITGLNEPRQAIKYSTKEGQAYVLNADLSITVIDYLKGEILENIS